MGNVHVLDLFRIIPIVDCQPSIRTRYPRSSESSLPFDFGLTGPVGRKRFNRATSGVRGVAFISQAAGGRENPNLEGSTES